MFIAVTWVFSPIGKYINILGGSAMISSLLGRMLTVEVLSQTPAGSLGGHCKELNRPQYDASASVGYVCCRQPANEEKKQFKTI